MAKSGIPWIDWAFDLAVRWLVSWAKALGITYEEINVYIFCIGWPLVSLGMAAWIIYLLGRVRNLKAIGRGNSSGKTPWPTLAGNISERSLGSAHGQFRVSVGEERGQGLGLAQAFRTQGY